MGEERRRNLSATAKGAISLGSGLTAGVAAAILSQPADTLLSQVCSSLKSLSSTQIVGITDTPQRSTKAMVHREV